MPLHPRGAEDRGCGWIGSVLEAVLFDLDDTLVDQRSAAADAVTARAAERGDDGDAVVERWTALSDRHCARYQRREISFREQRRARVREFLDVSAAGDDVVDALFEGYLRRCEAGWVRYDDAVPARRR